MLFEFAESVALLLSVALVYWFIIRKWPNGEPISQLIAGCLFGFICILGMRFPVTVEPGVFFDARTVFLSISSVFGGPVIGGLAGFLAAGYRIWIGGGGAEVGVYVIIMAVVAGLVYRKLADIGWIKINAISLLGLGIVIHFAEIGLFLLLPDHVVAAVMRSIAFPLILAFAPATAFLGLVFQAIREDTIIRHKLIEVTRDKSQALEKVIYVLSAALETRDPYTAGHEQNVASICNKIGAELGYTSHRLDGLNLAAIVHDVGKIQIPTDILAKPTKLTPQEFELIKCHPDVGADLIEGINFDWPIAEIIRQHHERLDGSGYPKGLKQDQILEEAKIIAVADTLEAMASHRPYRPGLGIDLAKEEILSGRGTKYDPRVVDACIKLINAKEIVL